MAASGSGFMIYHRGRWRALDLATGRVEGMHLEEIGFLVLNGGHAIIPHKREVLKELQLHENRCDSDVTLGEVVDFKDRQQDEEKQSPLNKKDTTEVSKVPNVPLLPRVILSRYEYSHTMKPPTRVPPLRASRRAARLSISSVTTTSGRLYSEEEDMCILKWLCAKPERVGKARGNTLWRDLENVFESLSGHARSWHSLRNRYLRLLLPALSNANTKLYNMVSPKQRKTLLIDRNKSVMENSLVRKHNNVKVGASSRYRNAKGRYSSMIEDENVEPPKAADGKRRLFNILK